MGSLARYMLYRSFYSTEHTWSLSIPYLSHASLRELVINPKTKNLHECWFMFDHKSNKVTQGNMRIKVTYILTCLSINILGHA